MSGLQSYKIEFPPGASRPLVENCSDDRNQLSSEFNPSILPDDYQDYLTLELSSSGEYRANTGPYVGILSCKDGSYLPIRPKTEVGNMTYFLRESGRIAQDLDTPFDEDVPYQTVTDNLIGMRELYVQHFLNQLDKLKRDGLLKQSIVTSIESSRVEGRINVNRYSKNILSGKPNKIPQSVKSQSIDNIPNMFLKLALRYLMNMRLIGIDRREIADRLDYFRPVSEFDRSAKIDEIKAQIREVIAENELPPSRSYYYPPLDSALLILDQSGITVDKIVDSKAQSFMFNMQSAFEDYIRRTVRRLLKPKGYDVYNGVSQAHRLDLYDSQSYSRLPLEPDILVADGMNNIGVIDVKYKDELSSSDHYQIWTYKQQYDVELAAFVSIPKNPSQRLDVEKYNRNGSGNQISNFRFWLGDFSASENSLSEFLSNSEAVGP
ncbi:5-methylcytosine restriction system specificity protein McrC [Halobaculum rubrum]|uniref:5-methylcytosine restriction system specificity protein McrC n=1 Tax=Halobaculum rubrum TaxID=2872158 RepID=UPI001CA3D5A1|nr:McrC family protein [Halobaculum rubrum]QZX99815.1 McrC family protein [Halobaculum rubrum]QZX99852.1 McrC family protein [Halobaculum rubrum]